MADDDEITRATALGDYADHVLGGQPDRLALGGTVDPDLAPTIQALRPLARRPAPPDVTARVWARVVAETGGTRSDETSTVEESEMTTTASAAHARPIAGDRLPTPPSTAGRAARPGPRIKALTATAGAVAAALVVAVLLGLPGGQEGAGGGRTAVLAPVSTQVPVAPAGSPTAVEGLDKVGGRSGPWEIPPGGEDLSIRLVRHTVAPEGRWVIPDEGEGWVDWWLVEGMLFVPGEAAMEDWTPLDGYPGVPMPGTDLMNRSAAPAVVLELRIESGAFDLPTHPGTTADVVAGGTIGLMDGQLAVVQVGPVWGPQIVDTTRGGAALVVVGPEAITLHRDGGEMVTAGDLRPGEWGGVVLGPGGWALLSSGAAFHFDAAPPDQASGPSAFVVTIAPNAAVVEEHERPTPTPVG